MQLTDYTVKDLKVLHDAVNNQKEAIISLNKQGYTVIDSDRKIISLIAWEIDIEQAIKDVQFEQERKDNLPIEP